MIDKKLMKDSMGRYRTNLFYEFNTSAHEDYPPIYTMRENEWRGLPSAYQIYRTCDTEYDAAMELVGSWLHWQKLLSSPIFMNGPRSGFAWTGLNFWREEKDIRDRAEAYVLLKLNAEKGNVQAQKLLFEGDKKRGRPSKAEVVKAAKHMAAQTASIKEDLKRIKLVAVNGKQARSN